MYRQTLVPSMRNRLPAPQQWEQTWAQFLASFTIWICVTVILIYGCYGDRHMVIGPSTSRLFKSSSLFVKQVEVRDAYQKGVFLHGFLEKPELSIANKWNASKYVIVGSYAHKGFYLWLNKDSSILMKWAAQTSILEQLQVSLIKGEHREETVVPASTSSLDDHSLNETTGGREVEYVIEEDNRYHVSIINLNPRSIIMVVSVQVISKMYNTTKAQSSCSTMSGTCRLNIGFPNTHFQVVTTPNTGNLDEWSVELAFVARIVTYIAILGLIATVMCLVVKYLGDCHDQRHEEETTATAQEITEAHPLMPDKCYGLPYGTDEEDLESNGSSSSEHLYDGQICAICYDMPRNCFFVPCGHCATCYDCAQRVMEGEGKICPICRRLVRKVRKLIIP